MPGGHAEHAAAADEVAFREPRKPAAHGVPAHAVDQEDEDHVPAAHAMQAADAPDVAPGVPYVPAAHTEPPLQSEAPAVAANVPGGHGAHVAASDEVELRRPKEPAAQAVPEHDEAPGEEAHVPAGHKEHEAAYCEVWPLGP